MWSYVAAAVVVAVVAVVLWSWRHYFWAGFRIPGPPAWPFIGNLLSLTSTPERHFQVFLDLHLHYGRVVRFWAGPQLTVLLTAPNDIQAILGNSKIVNRDYFLSIPFSKVVGNGLAVNRDEKWRTHRKLMTSAFHYKKIMGYVDIFGRRGDELVRTLKAFEDGRTFDPFNVLGIATMESIKESVFGAEFEWTESENMMDLFRLAGDTLALCFSRPYLLLDWVFHRTEGAKQLKTIRDEVDRRSADMIARKLTEFRSADKKTVNNKTRPFIDVLIEESEGEGSPMSLSELQDEMKILVAAAIDTSTTTLACMLTLMGIYPDIQQQVIDEVSAIFGEDTRRPTSEDLNKMSVIERCLKETLRMFPSVPFINREVGESVLLPSGYLLPRGTTLMVFAYAVHRDPLNFHDPDNFWPDRWLPEHSGDRHPYAFLAFGAGKRNCLGLKYAYLQMKTVVSCIFRHYRVTSLSTIKSMHRLGVAPIMRPLEGYKIQLHALNS